MTHRTTTREPLLTLPHVISSLASAALCVIALSFPHAGFLAWFSLVPYIRLLNQQPLQKRLLCSALFGWSFFCGLIYWIGYVSIPGLLILVTYLSVYPVIFGIVIRRTNRRRDLLLIPLVWVGLEAGRSYALTGLGWGLIGYSQAHNILLVQIVDRVGIWGLSALVVLVNIAIAQAIARRGALRQRVTAMGLAILLIAGSLAYGAWSLKQPAPCPLTRLSVIQPNIAQQHKWDPGQKPHILSQLQKLTLQAAQTNPDLIIWPETSVPGYLLDEPLLAIWVSRLAKQAGTYLLVGSPRTDHAGQRYYNSALLFDGRGELVSYYDKIHLVPFGEYIPFPRLLWFLQNIPIADFSAGASFSLLPITTKNGQSLDCAVLICFEDIFPDLVRKFRDAGADIFINITNEAWFERSTEPFQHLAISIVRAVENRRWFIRSANTGISGAIDPWGRIQAIVEQHGEKIFVEGTATAVLGAQ